MKSKIPTEKKVLLILATVIILLLSSVFLVDCIMKLDT